MSNDNKAVIPAVVADALDQAKMERMCNESILEVRNEEYPGETQVNGAALRFIPFNTLLRALINGYERELTEEEHLAKAYQNIRDEYQVCLFDGSSEEISFANGMRYALDTLSIKIEGVNA